jgi:hypothetical protein
MANGNGPHAGADASQSSLMQINGGRLGL